ncbi:MAG: EFR1 family ferrodoxin [Bacilli bacterium]|jgi:ferredoxin/flavodoxin|nr:EFR1 family ferrodoxin [Bacilli bacterium]MCH4228339.1 EFR1 family ferrodoxin [Bacilli bacterium]MCH4278402.1 EFR1 family ferrodoxin [Bacilli bacterium]MCI2054846.1 EFR1 family ferrodoxin [Bacilli bacterium]
MKALIFVFSGTGNTMLIAKAFASNFSSSEVREIKSPYPSTLDMDGFDVIGFGFPIHAFRAPELFVSFLKNLPPLKKKAFLFESSGEGLHLNDCAGAKSMRILKKKGYEVISDTHFIMPYNIISRFPDEEAEDLYLAGKEYARLISSLIKEGKTKKPHHPFFLRWVPPLFWIEWPFARINGKHFKIDEKKCTKCLKCLHNCPVNNIVYKDGKLVFLSSCSLCLRCAMNCPTDAISIGMLNNWKVNPSYDLEKRCEGKIFVYKKPTRSGVLGRSSDKYLRFVDGLLKAEAKEKPTE